MEFRPIQARYNSLHGLELRDALSPWLSASTKHSLLEIGVVILWPSMGGIVSEIMSKYPYEITFEYDGETITRFATRDPKALALAWKAFNSELPMTKADEWVDVPLPED